MEVAFEHKSTELKFRSGTGPELVAALPLKNYLSFSPVMAGKLVRTKKLSANAHAVEVARFNDACKKVKMNPGDTLRKLAEAFIEYVAQHERVQQPIRLSQPLDGNKK